MVLASTRRATNDKENANAATCATLPIKANTKPSHRNRAVHPHKACLLPPVQPSPRKKAAAMSPTNDALRSLTEELSENAAGTSSRSSNAASHRKLMLPKRLQRPLYRPVSSEAVSAIDPDLAEVPVEYIQKQLLSSGDSLYAMTRRTTPQYSKGSLPRELEVVVSDMIGEIPTHIAAVYSEKSPSHHKQHVHLFPIHALVFATQCAHLPPLPCPQPRARGAAEDTTTTLPVLPLLVPSPKTFVILMHYLYTHQTKNMLAALIPVPSYTLSPQELSQKLVQSCTVPALLSLLSTVQGVWGNAAKLGVFDEDLWQTIELSWTVLLNALETKTEGHMTTS